MSAAEDCHRKVFAQMRDKIRRMGKQKDTKDAKGTPKKRKRDDAAVKSTAKKSKPARKAPKKQREASKKSKDALESEDSDLSDEEPEMDAGTKDSSDAAMPATQSIGQSSEDDSDSEDDE